MPLALYADTGAPCRDAPAEQIGRLVGTARLCILDIEDQELLTSDGYASLRDADAALVRIYDLARIERSRS